MGKDWKVKKQELILKEGLSYDKIIIELQTKEIRELYFDIAELQELPKFNKAIDDNPNDSGAYALRGDFYCQRGDFDKALSDFSKVIEINPNDSEAYAIRGEIYYERGDFDKALIDFNKAIEINPNDSEAYATRAGIYYEKGEYDKAWDDIHKAESLGAEINPANIQALKEASGRDR
jgi:tetratricopeptide (TPR) repeat protein